MLEFITYKKFKKNRDQKVKAREEAKDGASRAASQSPTPGPQGPVLTDDDELFFERLTGEDAFSDEDGKRPPLPPRSNTPVYTWESDWESDSESPAVAAGGKGKTVVGRKESGEEKKKNNLPDGEKKKKKKKNDNSNSTSTSTTTPTNNKSRFSFWVRRPTAKNEGGAAGALEPAVAVIAPDEEEREKNDISRVLEDLNLSARNNKTFSLSKDSQELVSKFTLVLKDLVNGVPTAGRDLQHLFEDHDGTLARNFDKLPGSMKKLVTSLPNKLTSSLAPELLAVAAETQGLKTQGAPAGSIKGQAMKLLTPKNISELVTKPSAIVGMLKAIMNALKVRWPAFIGTNVIWSVALFLLMFVLWYCHKRGRETRLEKEKSAAAEMEGRVEELSDADSGFGSGPLPIAMESRGSPALVESPVATSSKL
ncbi:hypothetical protein M406DRAFT_328511 [Cryphonectria parasitica EP155]|uniref:Ring-like domain-containing protein n=1 Tax=Cryphonectria parasitica (strain ATCC 38755 / EP155) TaxID=660469 RepID=A0A9P4Y6N1_CRYP1|nr:uncharacterized protein M406DRAFT_328511 [Cryphonectria parasitica EP155]KAF3767429.1 hypothetical protein M406DRAFT_328511 [Cryphonectria parasitica EP155]